MNIKFLNLASKAIAILLFLTIYSTANSDELYDYIFEQIDTKTLLIDRYDPDYSAYIVNSGNNEVIVYDLPSLEELTNELAKLGTEQKITALRILSRSDSNYFTVVTYEYDYEAVMGNTNFERSVTGHSVLMSTDNGWSTVFDAVIQ